MANSLLDLGSMTNQAIQLGQLAQVQERNRISEQQNQIDAARVDQLNRFKTYDELEKQKADPLFITNLQRRVQLRQTQAKILGMPVPSTEELLGAEQEFDALTQAIRDPEADPAMRAHAASTFAVAAPGYGKQIYEALGAQQKYDQDSERHKILVQKYGSELTRLNQLIGRENIRQSVLTEELGKLSSVERIMDEHRPIITALANAKTDQERETIKRTRAQEWNAMQLATTQESTTYPLDQSKLYEKRQTLMQKRLQLQKMQKPIPPELDEEIAATELGYKALYAADRVLTDPTNKEVQRLFEIADQDVRLAYKSSGERMGNLRKERDDLRERHLSRLEAKDERANRIADAESYAQRRFLHYINAGKADAEAAELAAADAEKTFKGIPVDTTKLKNPNKVGRLSLDVNEPTAAFRTEAQKALTGIESTKNIITNLKSTIEQGNIGLAAAIKSTAYGFTSQIQGLADMVSVEAKEAKHKDFTVSKWFDPKLSTVDLLANTLAYRLINIEQGGRVTDKDLLEMKNRLNIKGLMAGKEDALQRLTVIENQLKTEEGIYRRTLKTFGQGGKKSLSEMSLQELADEYERSKQGQ